MSNNSRFTHDPNRRPFVVLDVDANIIEVIGYPPSTEDRPGVVVVADSERSHAYDPVAARNLAIAILRALDDTEPVDEEGDDE